MLRSAEDFIIKNGPGERILTNERESIIYGTFYVLGFAASLDIVCQNV